MATAYCQDNKRHRELGAVWEKKFIEMGLQYGQTMTPHQMNREGSAVAYYLGHDGQQHVLTLPDITLWGRPGEHHEVKHKNPSKRGFFGLEKYRLDSLLHFQSITSASVWYTIHNYDLNNGCTRDERRDCLENDIGHWMTAKVSLLAKLIRLTEWGTSYVNGVAKRVLIHYWQPHFFYPLSDLWVKKYNL